MKAEKAKEVVGEDNWEEFMEWIHGQTVGIYPDGSTDFYTWDVERFAEQIKRRKERRW